MAKEICGRCLNCMFTSVPLWYHGMGGWCRATKKYVNPLKRKILCRSFKHIKTKDVNNNG